MALISSAALAALAAVRVFVEVAERVGDIDPITLLTTAAFANKVHSSRTEQHIVNALRRAGQLTVSLVAVEGGGVIGHVAIPPVTVSSGAEGF